MPIHDWTRVRANRFHDFHQSWMITIRNALNAGRLPAGFFALVEQSIGGPEPDVVALEGLEREDSSNGVALLSAPPATRIVARSERRAYVRKTDRVVVRHPDREVVAVIEVVSPGNKSSVNALRAFTRKAAAFLRAGGHLLVVDLFPPGKRDPQGIHNAIWDRIGEEPVEIPADKRLTLAAYAARGPETTAYVEPVAVGDALPDMPVFLTSGEYVLCPLELAYLEAWLQFPAVLRGPLEAPPGEASS